MRLGFDIDGCLAQFNSAFHTLLIRGKGGDKFPVDYRPDNPPVWEWPSHFGYTEEEENLAWKEAWDSGTFWYRLHAYPGEEATLEVLEAVADQHDIYFITNRSGKQAKDQTEKWLFEHGVTFPTVLLAKRKEPIIASLRLDAYIDDNIDTMNELARLRDERALPETLRLYLRDSGHNKVNRHAGLIVVPSVWEMIRREGL